MHAHHLTLWEMFPKVLVVICMGFALTSGTPQVANQTNKTSEQHALQPRAHCAHVACQNGGVQNEKTCQCDCPAPFTGALCVNMQVGSNNETLEAQRDFKLVNGSMTFMKPMTFSGDVTVVGMAAFESKLKNAHMGGARPVYVLSPMEVTRSMTTMVVRGDGDADMGGAVLADILRASVRTATVSNSAKISGRVSVVSIQSGAALVSEREVGGQVEQKSPTESAVHVNNHLFIDNVIQTGKMTITHEELSIEGKLGVVGDLKCDTYASLFGGKAVHIQGSLKIGMDKVQEGAPPGPDSSTVDGNATMQTNATTPLASNSSTPQMALLQEDAADGSTDYSVLSDEDAHTPALYVSKLLPQDGFDTIPVLGSVYASQHVSAKVIRSVIGRYLNMNGVLVKSGDHVGDVRSVIPSLKADTLQPNVTTQVKNGTANATNQTAIEEAQEDVKDAKKLTGRLSDLLKGKVGDAEKQSVESDAAELGEIPAKGSYRKGAVSYIEVSKDGDTDAAPENEANADANADADAAKEEKERANEFAQSNAKANFKENWCGGDIKRQSELIFPGANLFSYKQVVTGLGTGLQHCSLFEGISMCPAVIEFTVFSPSGTGFHFTVHTGRHNDRTYMYNVVPGVFAKRQDDNSWEVAGLGDNALYNFRFVRAECRVQVRAYGVSTLTVVATGTQFLLDDYYYNMRVKAATEKEDDGKKQLEKDEGALSKLAKNIEKDIKMEESGAIALAESNPLE